MLDARPVHGFWRRLRWGADVVLIAILLAIPWIRVGGEPLILLDLPARRFHVFGLTIFPGELYFLWLLVAIAAISLFLFTAIGGRLWCGWACPQTVFTDVFAAIARAIEGDPGPRVGSGARSGSARRAPWWRRVATRLVWIVCCAGIGFHLVAYFVSPYTMAADLRAGTLSATVGGLLFVATSAAYLDFAVVRQTFCKFLCPYARLQSVLFDRDTLVVTYDPVRGEPRGKRGKTTGDCVDCSLCVQVCPTDIDIREGMQLECIACTQCIDACNGVMEKIGRPANLIGYRSLEGVAGTRGMRLLRPRVVVYGLLLGALVLTFGTALAGRSLLHVDVAHGGGSGSLYQRTPDGRVGNAYRLFIENRDRRDHDYWIALEAPGDLELVAGVNPMPVPAGAHAEARVFVLAPEGGPASRPVVFHLAAQGAPSLEARERAVFLGPGDTR